MYVWRNTEACSPNLRCRWKTVSIKYYECVCSVRYSARNAHAPYCIVLCGVSGSTNHMIPRYLVNGTICGKKLLIIKCVLIFSTNLSEEFFILKTPWDIIINLGCLRLTYQLFLLRLTEFEFSRLMKIRLLEAKLFRADGRTETQPEGRTHRRTNREADIKKVTEVLVILWTRLKTVQGTETCS